MTSDNVSVPDPTSDSAPHCLVEQIGHKLVVTMNRPEARNALSGEMLAIMSDAWDRVNSDDSIRVCILTGSGGYFCAGADLKSMSKKPPSESFESGEYDPSVIKGLLKGFRLTKPLIAAVEGPAIAGGTEILQGTDIRVAGENAKFGISEARWSLYPMGGSAVRLVRQIPYTVAADLLLTGRHILAPEAKELGLIGHVVPDGDALTKAHEIADLICANGPLAVQAILKTMRDSEGKHEDDCWKDDAQVGAAVFSSNDAKEGPRAFSEKRAPQFTGS
jgi:enoyl-CoA hydratase